MKELLLEVRQRSNCRVCDRLGIYSSPKLRDNPECFKPVQDNNNTHKDKGGAGAGEGLEGHVSICILRACCPSDRLIGQFVISEVQ